MDPKQPKQLQEFLLTAARSASSAGSRVWTAVEPQLRQWGSQTRSLLRQYLDGGYDGSAAAPSPEAPSITFEGVAATFGGIPALSDVSGTFAPGSMSAV